MALAEAEAEIARLRSQAAVSPPIRTEPVVGGYSPPPHSRPLLLAAIPGEDEEEAEAAEEVEGKPPATASDNTAMAYESGKNVIKKESGKYVIKKESERTALKMKFRKACSRLVVAFGTSGICTWKRS